MPAGRRPCSALVAVCALVLTGCTAQPAPPPLRPTASPAASGLPSGFPASVPLLPGRVVAGTVDGADLHAWVASADPEVGYRDAKALLVDAGFVLTKDRVATGGGDGQACSTASLCVNFTGSDDAVYGETVQYDVFHGTGIVG